jgi:hypothetical protein
MSIEQRQHVRFSLDIPAIRYTKYGEASEILLSQISIGGCLTEWDENVYLGDEFRLLIRLPNKNFLPLTCKVLYKFEGNGIGAQFLSITQFEQELLSKVISQSLENLGLPTNVNPFAEPKKSSNKNETPKITDSRRQKEDVLDEILSANDHFQI